MALFHNSLKSHRCLILQNVTHFLFGGTNCHLISICPEKFSCVMASGFLCSVMEGDRSVFPHQKYLKLLVFSSTVLCIAIRSCELLLCCTVAHAH